ncbi:hypothetical protein E3T54_01410 [Cryobacterium sp. Sr8]|uniref:glycoside hydrolase family 99-like domain-containing protein n=1 Tax=Cryobacterium sp. Sr8 TaxID=1259203 RepID=UPI00106C95D0|nr:glycoside hydrolase family 99-like domain-containing protein [Cryobacterium sp. Sr8]TFD81605.1 hypothetical protein E3T54_01410 [Cryobacterium sp. Sr8]
MKETTQVFLRREKGRSFAGSVYGILLLVTLVPAAAALATGAAWSPLVKVQALLISTGLAVAVYRAATAKSFSLSWSVFWLWTYLFMGLAQLYQLAFNTFPWNGQFTEDTILTAQLILILGCAVVYATAGLVTRRNQASEYSSIGREKSRGHAPARRALVIVLASYCAISATFIALMGASLFQGRSVFQQQLLANVDIPGAGTLFFVSTAGAIVVPAVGIVCRRNGVDLPTFLLVFSAVLGFIVTNPLTGSRFFAGSFMVAMLAALLVRQPILRLMPAGIGGVLITLFPSLDLLRGDGTGAARVGFVLPREALTTFDFDAFEMLLREVTVAGHIPAGLPTQVDLLVAPFARWIPVLSDLVHGNASGPVVAELTGMSYTNVSMPLWGEAHLVGGFLGVAIAFAALGVLLGTIRRPVVIPAADRASATRLMIDAPVAALLFIVLRGSLYEVLGYLLLTIALAVVVWGAGRPWSNSATPISHHANTPNHQRARTIAFYLPQFHAIPENDEWWGKGFTEWVNVGRATPQFEGHDHPRQPSELGHYDLGDGKVMHAQAELAGQFDVDAFCFYFYWFGGKRLLEKPLDAYLATGPDFPFCISWANESWTRRWDGKEDESLIAQEYSSTAAEDVFDAFLPYLNDARYLRVDGAAVILVHRADHLPDHADYADTWRRLAEEHGVGPIHLVAVETNAGISPGAVGFDALCEFPPVGSNTLSAAKLLPVRGLNSAFAGRLMSYPRLVRAFTSRRPPSFIRYRGVTPSWDNTARRREAATTYVDASPFHYHRWLTHARAYEQHVRGANGLVFVNAWNEWAEGAYLEPDETNGRGYLEATRIVQDKEILRPPKSRTGLASLPWARSLFLAAAGSLLKLGRRVRRRLDSQRSRTPSNGRAKQPS